MLSFRNSGKGEGGQDQRPHVILLEGMELQSAQLDVDKFEDFRSDIRQLRSAIENTKDPGKSASICRAAIKAFSEYNRALERQYEMRQRELLSMISKTLQTITAGGNASQSTLQELTTLDGRLTAIITLQDIFDVKTKLTSVLAALLRDIRSRQRTSAPAASQDPKGPIQKSDRERLTEIDATTGLGGNAKARDEIGKVIGTEQTAYLSVMLIEHLQAINLRYGAQTGDQVIFMFSQHIAQVLNDTDELFRWRGPIFLVLSTGGQRTAISMMQRLSSQPFEHHFTIDNRSVVLSVKFSWELIAIDKASTVDKISNQIETFASDPEARSRSVG
jgi:GGDEF domain-containing protein